MGWRVVLPFRIEEWEKFFLTIVKEIQGGKVSDWYGTFVGWMEE